MKQNYKLTVAYDGSRYYGWEHQPDKPTIQGKLEDVLSRMTDAPVDVIGAGRTDAGVHAKAMTASAVLDTALSPEDIRDYMNRYLPDDICVREVRAASERFHARYKAVGKTYCYTCYVGALKPVFDRKYVLTLDGVPDVAAMQRAAALLVGEHDFKSFCGNPKMKKSTVRLVDHGTGFLQNMVRILVGTLLEVGFGKRPAEQMPAILESRDRTQAGYTVPPQGLCLVKVDY